MQNGEENDSCGKRFADGQSSDGARSRDASRRLLLSCVVSVGLPASGELFDGVELLIMRSHVDDTFTVCDCALPDYTVVVVSLTCLHSHFLCRIGYVAVATPETLAGVIASCQDQDVVPLPPVDSAALVREMESLPLRGIRDGKARDNL